MCLMFGVVITLSFLLIFMFLCGKQVELRDVDNGNKLNLRFGTEESVESMFVPYHFKALRNYISIFILRLILIT